MWEEALESPPRSERLRASLVLIRHVDVRRANQRGLSSDRAAPRLAQQPDLLLSSVLWTTVWLRITDLIVSSLPRPGL
jgi:hypothetical protein